MDSAQKNPESNFLSQNLNNLENLIRKTKEAVAKSGDDILEIVNDTRSKIHKLKDELIEVRARIANIIVTVDSLQTEVKRQRDLFDTYNREYGHRSKESGEVYHAIFAANKALEEARSAESALNSRRNSIERYLKENAELLERSEKVLTQVMVALDYLDLSEVPAEHENVATRIIEAQDSEKERLSRDIHDGPAQSLVNIMLRAELAEKLIGSSPNKLRGELKQIQSAVRETLSDIRRIIFDLMPYTMVDHGIIKTLANLIKNTRQTEFKFEYTEKSSIKAKLVESNVFRIIQEIYSNIVKHSRAKYAKIILNIYPDKIEVIATDNGRGFDVDKVVGGYGLRSISDRVKLLQGAWTLDSDPSGTRIKIDIAQNIGEDK